MEEATLLFLVCLLLTCANIVECIKSIFILGGQSNMVGEGGVMLLQNGTVVWDGIIPPESQPNPQIFRLTKNTLSWEEAQEPLHKDRGLINRGYGIGPGMPFANSVLKRRPNIGEIGLVPCAVGGSFISQWMRGTAFYDKLLIRAQAALASSGGGTIRALLWYQGEQDTFNETNAKAYKSQLVRFLTDVRNDLQSPSLPVFQVALASGDPNYIEIVREAQLQIGLPNVTTVDAKGLELMPDDIHLTTPSQVRLGTMLAHAFLQSLPPP